MTEPVKYRFHSLEDYLISTSLSIDGQLDDGCGASFPVKGREIEATVLFSDISGFSRRTLDLSPAETLIFVNHFFCWVTAEALRGMNGIVDKYIGDEFMIVFSKEFGSEDPFVEAVRVACWMCEQDAWGFCPHIGIASGKVIVGYVGTPVKYNCSTYGAPVALAARCAGVKPEKSDETSDGGTIVFPSFEWGERELENVIPPTRYEGPDGRIIQQPSHWMLRPAREVAMKNLPSTQIRELVKTSFWLPSHNPEQLAKERLRTLQAKGRYWPK